MRHGWKESFVTFVFCMCVNVTSHAQTFATLATFDKIDGASPAAPLIQGVDGSYYGTTVYGGNGAYCLSGEGCGTIFRISSQGALATLYSFCSQPNCADGEYPVAGLAQTADGGFYGTASEGGPTGTGTVFEINRAGSLTTVHNFCSQPNCSDGAYPAALIQAVNGSFYGTTFEGGINGTGTVFKLTRSGTLTTIHAFDSFKNGIYPEAPLVQAANGALYGTTTGGGHSDGEGTIFRITTDDVFTLVYRFCSENVRGGGPSGLIEGPDGNFYGTTEFGGSQGDGAIFQITPHGELTTLYNFGGRDGYQAGANLLLGTDGNFYGNTAAGGDQTCHSPYGCGTIFSVTSSGTLTTVHVFELSDGESPSAALIQGTNGVFYGTTITGGSNQAGTVFSVDMGLGPFVTFIRPVGRVGQTGGILGQGFTGTTSVLLNGTPASFSVVSDTFIRATVPPGATTGYVTATTPTDTLTSNVPFRVIE